MRRIISPAEQEKKKKIKQFGLGGLLIIIIVASILGYSLNPAEKKNKITYHGIDFAKDGDYWYAKIGGTQFTFKYNPEEINQTGYITKTLSNYQNQPLYISSDNGEAETEIYRNIDRFILRRQYACLQGEKCEKQYPVKNCTDNFLIIRETNKSSLREDNNCVFIEGKSEELTNLADNFLYKILKI